MNNDPYFKVGQLTMQAEFLKAEITHLKDTRDKRIAEMSEVETENIMLKSRVKYLERLMGLVEDQT